MTSVHVTMLGRFEVAIDGRVVPGGEWRRRHAETLVKVLALSPGHRLHREQIVDALWPDDTLESALPKLHKAAHFARRATDTPNAIVLRSEMVALFPGADLTIDVEEFETLARTALAEGDADAAERALTRYGGELIPEDRYQPWAEARREQLELRRVELLRITGRWSDVLDLDHTDEAAHVALIRQYADAGDRHAGLRQFEYLARVLQRDLGVAPGPEAQELRERLLLTVPARSVAQVDAPPLADRPCCGSGAQAEARELARALHSAVLATLLLGRVTRRSRPVAQGAAERAAMSVLRRA